MSQCVSVPFQIVDPKIPSPKIQPIPPPVPSAMTGWDQGGCWLGLKDVGGSRDRRFFCVTLTSRNIKKHQRIKTFVGSSSADYEDCKVCQLWSSYDQAMQLYIIFISFWSVSWLSRGDYVKLPRHRHPLGSWAPGLGSWATWLPYGRLWRRCGLTAEAEEFHYTTSLDSARSLKYVKICYTLQSVCNDSINYPVYYFISFFTSVGYIEGYTNLALLCTQTLESCKVCHHTNTRFCLARVGCLAKRFSSSQDQNERFGSRVAKTTFKVFGDMSNVGKTLRATTRFWTLSTTVFEVMRLPLLARVDSALTWSRTVLDRFGLFSSGVRTRVHHGWERTSW